MLPQDSARQSSERGRGSVIVTDAASAREASRRTYRRVDANAREQRYCHRAFTPGSCDVDRTNCLSHRYLTASIDRYRQSCSSSTALKVFHSGEICQQAGCVDRRQSKKTADPKGSAVLGEQRCSVCYFAAPLRRNLRAAMPKPVPSSRRLAGSGTGF